ncbi:glycosyltransferase [Congregibacter sp.]|nr:glycosyltransferase [Congregibacter sp.]MDA8962193.1 glycosyltransferase [Congregibacter sp.]
MATHIVGLYASSVMIVSFRRQYPKFLFPGESDKVESPQASQYPRASYELDTINPLTWERVARDIVASAPDLVVMPAWTFFVAPCLGWIARKCQKAGIRVTQIVHNVSDHEASWWKSRLTGFQLSHADGFVAHNTSMRNDLVRQFPATPIAIHPLPVNNTLPKAKGLRARKAKLELLFFGIVRNYKGLDLALKAMNLLKPSDVRLTIVGEFWEDLDATEALVTDLGITEQVTIVSRYVSDEEAAEYFASSDAVLMPYRSASGSAVIPLAYYYGKPVVASNLPGLTELISEGKTGWIMPENTPEQLSCVIDKFVTRQACEEMATAIGLVSANLQWPAYIEGMLQQAGLSCPASTDPKM